jgi:hypothetical protein
MKCRETSSAKDWPDVRETRERRAELVERLLGPKPIRAPDQQIDTKADEMRRQGEGARSSAFWRQRETRTLAERLGLRSADQRLQYDDPAILPPTRGNDGKANSSNIGSSEMATFDALFGPSGRGAE